MAFSHSDTPALSIRELVREAEEHLVPGTNVFPRCIAADILHHVALHGEYGGIADGITPFLIGIAIHRLVPNYVPDGSTADWRELFLAGLDFRSTSQAQSID